MGESTNMVGHYPIKTDKDHGSDGSGWFNGCEGLEMDPWAENMIEIDYPSVSSAPWLGNPRF